MKVPLPLIKISIIFLSGVLLSGVANGGFKLPGTKFSNVQYQITDSVEQVKFFFNKQPEYKVFPLKYPNRLVVDINDCFFPLLHQTKKIDTLQLQKLRISQFNPHTVRCVIDLNQPPENSNYRIFDDQAENSILCIVFNSVLEEQIDSKHAESKDGIKNLIHRKNRQQKVKDRNDFKGGGADIDIRKLNSFLNESAVQDLSTSIHPIADISETKKFLVHGSVKNETAWKTNASHQFSKIKNIFQTTFTGVLSPSVSYHVGGRIFYDAVYDLIDRYPDTVKDDQEFEMDLREAYVDIGFGELDLRLGNQQIVWGQAVGLFFADMVNPKDLREYILPEFDQIRIPVLSANLEYYADDLYFQFIFIPFPKFNKYGKPGSEFDFSKINQDRSVDILMNDPKDLPRTINNSEIGFRISKFINGWDLSGFYFYDFDNAPVNYREILLNPPEAEKLLTISYQPRYERVHKAGITFSKDYQEMIFKGEFILTGNQPFVLSDLSDHDGIIKKDTFDWLIGIDNTFFDKLDFNLQLMQGIVMNHDVRMVTQDVRTSFSIWLKTGFFQNKLEPEIFFVSSLDHQDILVRPKIAYHYSENLSFSIGADFFEGESDGDFGFFDANDRVYVEGTYYY